MFPLLAVGLGALLDAVLPAGGKRIDLPPVLSRLGESVSARVLVMTAMMTVFSINEVYRVLRFSMDPETAVRDVHRRVWHMTWVQERLDLDEATLLEVDMGAHMYYSGFHLVDIAGLVDVPMARHSDFNKKFIDEYVFQERLPEFIHVHDYWARTSRIPKQRRFKTDYIAIPGYPTIGNSLHIGGYIRRDLFIERIGKLAPPPVFRFAGDISLLSYDLPSPEVAAGGRVYLQTWWRAMARKDGFTAMVWMDDGDGNRAVTALVPGYNWYSAGEWHSQEKVSGRFWLEVPQSMPEGTYRVGMVLLDDTTGMVLPTLSASPVPAVYLPGEVTFNETITVVSAEEADRHAEDDRKATHTLAAAGDCDAAWSAWKDATRHRSRDTDWHAAHKEEARTAVAGCWLRKAEDATDRADTIAHLTQAHRWDHHLDGLADVTQPLAAVLDAEGDARMALEDWEEAYALYSDAMAIDPTRSWTRRKAEDARDKRLDITRPGREEP